MFTFEPWPSSQYLETSLQRHYRYNEPAVLAEPEGHQKGGRHREGQSTSGHYKLLAELTGASLVQTSDPFRLFRLDSRS